MAFKLKVPSPLARMEFYKRAASSAYTIDTLVQADADNSTCAFLAATAASKKLLGSLQRAVASTDSNYATATKEPILVDECGIWEADVGTGTPTVNYEQFTCDLKDSATVDVTATSNLQIFIVNFVSATKLQVKLRLWAGGCNA